MRSYDRVVVRPGAGEVGWFVLDDQRHEVEDAVDYLVAQGFSEAEARQYLRSLPRSGS